jgi:hypothetical protein
MEGKFGSFQYSKNPSEKLVVFGNSRDFHFHDKWCLIILFTKARHKVISWAKSIQFTILPQFLGTYAKLKKKATSSFMSVCPFARKNSPATGRILIKFDVCVFSKVRRENSIVSEKHTNNGYCTWRPKYIYDTLAEVFLEWDTFQTKFLRKIKTHFVFDIFFSRNLFRLGDNLERYSRARQATDDNKIWRMRFAFWLTKARIQTHTQNV